MDKEHKLEVTVGAFVLVGVLLVLAAVLLLGRARHVFEQRVKLHAVFSDVAGLVSGAPVRVSGVNVGTVSRITFVRTPHRPRIQVSLEISRSSLGLIRSDSVARISSQGLLGDKIVEISAGSTTASPLGAGGEITTAEAPDLDRMLAQMGVIIDDARRVADRAAGAIDQLADRRTITAVRGSLVHIDALLHEAHHGHGLAHSLFYDRRTAGELDRMIAGLAEAAQHVDRGVARIDRILDATDRDGEQLLNNLSRAARELGVASQRLTASPALTNLERATGDVAAMTSYARRGQGTIGALIMDPTIYDQLVAVLGGIGRSRILRALVRYAISRDDERDVGRRVIDEGNVPKLHPPHGDAGKAGAR
jgi:phospholipid/cholesterol/gamma-HCH transport system substrate-binding protein